MSIIEITYNKSTFEQFEPTSVSLNLIDVNETLSNYDKKRFIKLAIKRLIDKL